MKCCPILGIQSVFSVTSGRNAFRRKAHRVVLISGLFTALLFGSGCVSEGLTFVPVVVKRTQIHMGTLVAVTAVATSRQSAQEATSVAFQEVRRLEGLLSTWIASSELSHVNEAAGLKPIPISPDTMHILEEAIEMGRLTEGGFNILIGPAVEAWSVLDRQDIPSELRLQAVRSLMDPGSLHLNTSQGTVYLAKAGMRVDVGGIGKGYAADMAVAAMKKAGATAGVVALSGDIKTFGRLPHGAMFPFGIRHPRREGAVLAFIDLQDEAISTAGDYERYFERDGVRYHHILDPVTLQPARACQSVTIVARDGITADGLDTGVFVMGRERGLALVERLPGVGAVIVDHEGKVWISSYLKGRVRMVRSD
jgi:FAD:protein FMN transferase